MTSYPFLVGAPVFLAVGSGLLYAISVSTSSAQLAGYQILAGIGTGIGMQNVVVAIQYVPFSSKFPPKF